MKTNKFCWNDVFYCVILSSLQIHSFMIWNAHKINRNALKLYSVSLFQFYIISCFMSAHNITKTKNIGSNCVHYWFILLSLQTKSLWPEIHTKMNAYALKLHCYTSIWVLYHLYLIYYHENIQKLVTVMSSIELYCHVFKFSLLWLEMHIKWIAMH
jgi:hypothetical protein